MSDRGDKYLLGLDLGSASIGWTAVKLDGRGSPYAVLAMGVRTFEAGVDGLLDRGREEARNQARRQARQQRRNLRRRAARRRDLFALLQAHGLLPPSTSPSNSKAEAADAQHRTLQALDLQLHKVWRERLAAGGAAAVAADHLLPYLLRARALSERLDLYEVGRAIYHLVQRRGFKSNRKEGRQSLDKQEELGKVKTGISELAQAMAAAEAPSLAAYFSSLDPTAFPVRDKIRRRWTGREMFEREFQAIWAAQAPHHSDVLTSSLRDEISRLLFYQRPLLVDEDRVGACELEPGQKRAAWTTLAAQRFRLLQGLNNLAVQNDAYSKRKLSREERALVLAALETRDQTMGELRKLIQLPRTARFNFEQGSKQGAKKKLSGDHIGSLMRRALGDRWGALSMQQRQELVNLWAGEQDSETLQKKLITDWSLTAEAAKALAAENPETRYCKLSLKAIEKLLPHLEAGLTYPEAELKEYGERPAPEGTLRLQPVEKALPSINNPAVRRALTELRKLINALVREYGKPHQIRVELARDLKNPRDVRARLYAQNEDREKERKAAAKVLQESGIRPSGREVEKYLLWKECGEVCPYTGRSISFDALFVQSQFDVEHIIPFSQYPDDSFANKTLCWHEENRHVKKGKLPAEAYSPENLQPILDRIKRWPHANPGKLKRFEIPDVAGAQEFSARHLSDTRYTSKLAVRYLSQLYGERELARPDGTYRQAVAATSGGVTATLRRRWLLEKILRQPEPSANGLNPGKQRSDHRHHAIDALVIALTSQATVQAMSVAAAAGAAMGLEGVRSMQTIPSPWPNFVDSVRPHVDRLVISHRPSHRLSGAIHEETLYGRPRQQGGKTVTHIRKPLVAISAGDVEGIVDPAVRRVVEEKITSCGGLEAFKKRVHEDPPLLPTRRGPVVPVWRVRVARVQSLRTIGTGAREKHVIPGGNHHIAVFATRDRRGKERWESLPVSLLDAYERRRREEAIVQRSCDDPDAEFQFSLMNGDLLELRGEYDGASRDGIWRVRTLESNGPILLSRLNDARPVSELGKSGDRWRPGIETLRKLGARKITIDLLGVVREAHD